MPCPWISDLLPKKRQSGSPVLHEDRALEALSLNVSGLAFHVLAAPKGDGVDSIVWQFFTSGRISVVSDLWWGRTLSFISVVTRQGIQPAQAWESACPFQALRGQLELRKDSFRSVCWAPTWIESKLVLVFVIKIQCLF